MTFQWGEHLKQQMTDNVRQFNRRPLSTDNLRHAAVVICAVKGDDGVPSFVLTRRAARMRAHAAQWALPGGRLDEGETIEEAALRELREEVDLHLAPENILGVLDDYETRSGYIMTPVVAWTEEDITLSAQETEVSAIYRIPFAEFHRDDSPEFITIPESDRPVIRLYLNDYRVHAPTAAVIHQFAEVCLFGRHTRVAHYEQPVFAWK